MSLTDLPISEIFGPTFQGEGPSTGQQAVFVRVSGCNLHCVWCDTPYTWRFSDTHQHQGGKVFDRADETEILTLNEIADQIFRRIPDIANPPLLVLTGGEPMLYQAQIFNLLALTDRLHLIHEVEIETAGTRAPSEDLISLQHVYFNVSPKLTSSLNLEADRLTPALTAFRDLAELGRATFKFVVGSEQDIEEVSDLLTRYSISPGTVYLMPEAASRTQLVEKSLVVAEAALKLGVHFSTRLQVLLWDVRRGV